MRKALALFAILPGVALADFIAVGPIEGQICSGFIIESCHFEEITAVKDDGQLYTINRRYPEVSTHDQSKGRCWINLKASRAGLLGNVADALSSIDFHTNDSSGEYVAVDPEYLTFRCTESR